MENKNDKTQTPVDEEQLSALLAGLRHEPTEEADFESRFLSDFHERIAKQQPEQEPFMARVRRFFSAIWQNKAVYGTSFAALCLLCVTYIAWSPTPTAQQGSVAAFNAANNQRSRDELRANAQMVRNAPADKGAVLSVNGEDKNETPEAKEALEGVQSVNQPQQLEKTEN